jgi:hypothetical protein
MNLMMYRLVSDASFSAGQCFWRTQYLLGKTILAAQFRFLHMRQLIQISTFYQHRTFEAFLQRVKDVVECVSMQSGERIFYAGYEFVNRLWRALVL